MERTEKETAEVLGIARTSLRALRKAELAEGPDWFRGEKDVVIYRQTGIEKIAAALKRDAGGQKTGEADGPLDTWIGPEKNDGGAAAFVGVAADQVPVLSLVVTRHRMGVNSKLIEARAEDGALLRVRVHDNENYRPGMKMRARLERPGLAVIVGRGPRFPGRW